MPDVEIVAVVDTNRERADEVAASSGTRAVYDPRDLSGRGDAETIAVPTERHEAVARPFLHACIPALVEKPLTWTIAEVDALVSAAGRVGVPLAVGHTERFNLAVDAARPLLVDPRF